LASENNWNGLTTYTYDNAYRQSLVQTQSLRSTYTYDAADQLTSINALPSNITTHLYDQNGSRLRIYDTAGVAENNVTYTWDAANRLRTAQLKSGQVLTYLYHYDNLFGTLRVRKTGMGRTESLFWDGDTPLMWQAGGGLSELSVNGATLSRTIGSRAGSITISRQYHTDAMGSIQAITDATGTATETPNISDAWGGTQSSGTALDSPLNWLGGLGYWYDPDIALYYVRARWLEHGKWLSVDPVESEPRYTYAHNMPTTHVDPSGMQTFSDFTKPGTGGIRVGQVQSSSDVLNDPNIFTKKRPAGYTPSDDSLLGELRALGNALPDIALAAGQAIRDTFSDLYHYTVDDWRRQASIIGDGLGTIAKKQFKEFLKLCGHEKWFKQLDHLFQAWRNGTDNFTKNLTPTSLTQGGDYIDGFLHGLINGLESALEGLNPLTWIAQLAALAKFLLKTDGRPLLDRILDRLKPLLRLFLSELDLQELPVRDRGELAGNLIITCCIMVLSALLEPALAEAGLSAEIASEAKALGQAGKIPKPGRFMKAGKAEERALEALDAVADDITDADLKAFNPKSRSAKATKDLTKVAQKKKQLLSSRGKAKIVTSNAHGHDPLTARVFARLVAEDPVATRAYSQIQKQGIDVILEFGKPPTKGLAGEAISGRDARVIIYMQNNPTAKDAVATMVHESLHIKIDFQRRLVLYNQREEIRAFTREFLYSQGRRPKKSERSAIELFVEEQYPELEKGR
jgi:RHS repeat-associated protein